MRARGQGRAQDRLGVGVPAPVGLDPRSGMMGGTRPSAAAAGGARGWAAPSRKRSGPPSTRCDGEPGCRTEGAQPDFGDLGSKPKQTRNGEEGKR
jgi:hypothetical protein